MTRGNEQDYRLLTRLIVGTSVKDLLRDLLVDFCEFTLEHGTNEPAGRIALLFEAVQSVFKSSGSWITIRTSFAM